MPGRKKVKNKEVTMSIFQGTKGEILDLLKTLGILPSTSTGASISLKVSFFLHQLLKVINATEFFLLVKDQLPCFTNDVQC